MLYEIHGALEKGILENSKIVQPTVDLDFFDTGTRLGEDTADEAAMEMLKSGFKALLLTEGL